LLRGFTPRNGGRDGSAPHNGGTFVIASGAKQSGEAGSARISRHSERSDETLRSAQGDILQLVSLCADNGPEESRGKVTPPLHWQDVIETARREGLSLLLYKSLKDSNGLLPQGYLEELRREYFTTLGRNKYYFRELVRCLKVMDVPVILLKGASLLPTVYNDLGARPLGDFDILIQRRNLEKIKGCLVSLGYEPHGGSGLYANSIYFIKREEPVLPLEVHWHIENAMFPNFERLKMERMWQAALPVKLEDYQGLIFAPHHQLIHLSVHALKHSYDRLILLWDMHQVINYYGERLNWEELIKEASDFCLSRPLFYGLYLTKLLMNTNVPRYVLDRLKPLSLGLGERAFVYFIKRGIRKPGLQYLVYFPMNRGMVNKMRFLWWAFLPPRDILSEMEALDDSEIGAAHYLRCFSRRFEWAWRLYRCK
jgi:hypothetical protein